MLVAPHAGAWIETLLCVTTNLNERVAPHAGAWIETAQSARKVAKTPSRAPRGRVD